MRADRDNPPETEEGTPCATCRFRVGASWSERRSRCPSRGWARAADLRGPLTSEERQLRALEIGARRRKPNVSTRPPAPNPNGDEDRYPDRRGSFSKTMPHDGLGEVEPDAYRQWLAILASGKSEEFAKVPRDPNAVERLNNPQATYAFSGPIRQRCRWHRRRISPAAPRRLKWPSSTGWPSCGMCLSATTTPRHSRRRLLPISRRLASPRSRRRSCSAATRPATDAARSLASSSGATFRSGRRRSISAFVYRAGGSAFYHIRGVACLSTRSAVHGRTPDGQRAAIHLKLL